MIPVMIVSTCGCGEGSFINFKQISIRPFLSKVCILVIFHAVPVGQ